MFRSLSILSVANSRVRVKSNFEKIHLKSDRKNAKYSDNLTENDRERFNESAFCLSILVKADRIEESRLTPAERRQNDGVHKMPRGRTAKVEPKTEGARLLLEAIENDPKLDQTRAAREAGLPLGLINHILHGRRSLSLEVAVKIEKRFGVPPAAWLEPARESREAA